MSNNPKFWPLDDNSEDQIYDTLAWDLPGFRERKTQPRTKRRQ